MSSVHDLEDAVYAAARAALGDAALATAALTRAIVDRSERYTSDRARISSPRDKQGDLAARSVFFTIADAMKIAVPLAELASRDAVPGARPVRVVDLGAGCGAMSLGLIASTELPLSITAIDRDGPALAIARAAVVAFAAKRGREVTIETRTDDALSAPLPRAELIVIGTLLNELAAADQVALVERALAAITEDGAVVVIEPALRATSRALHELRDAIIGRGAGHVFAPCTRRSAPCPALADPDDWCHEHRPLALPPRTAELARLTHLRDGGMKFSYLVLRRTELALTDEPDAWRIVSAPRSQKGKLELIGCSGTGRVALRLLRKNRTDHNREIERADRGDVLVIATTPDSPGAERIEITRETIIARRTPGTARRG